MQAKGGIGIGPWPEVYIAMENRTYFEYDLKYVH